jgi:hypothetical protein
MMAGHATPEAEDSTDYSETEPVNSWHAWRH